MPRILSTKKLSPSQQQLLLAAGVSLIQYDAIKIESLVFKMPQKIGNLIFTSQNSVQSFLANMIESPFIQKEAEINCFCVGKKTAALLTANNYKVIAVKEYGADLGHYIVNHRPNDHYTFFCAKQRREEMPAILKVGNVDFKEVEVYKTRMNQKHFKQVFDAVLFFSPSGVQSYLAANALNQSLAVCIGHTTATEAKKSTNNVLVSNSTSVEGVIAKAVLALRRK